LILSILVLGTSSSSQSKADKGKMVHEHVQEKGYSQCSERI
jgi:hypothetical protein